MGSLALNGAAALNAVNDVNPVSAAFDAGFQIGSGRVVPGLLAAGLAIIPESRGATRLLGFAPGRWLAHFEKHGAEMGSGTAVEYLRGANALMRGGRDVETFVRANGDKLFYREATNEFGVLASDAKTIRTYFRPNEGRQYFLDQMKQ